MEKRLTRTDYLFAVTFIFMLVVAMGAFFFGLKMGQDRSSLKYEDLLNKQNEAAKSFTAYHQQYLVSFYHTIYQPYREFHKKWFEKTDELMTNRTADASLILKDLSKLAQESYDSLGSKSMPDSSPLLQEAHKDYMKSLKLFGEGLKSYSAKANGIPAAELIAQLQADPYLGEAKTFALKAEKSYYESIDKWYTTINPQFKPVDVTKPLSLNDWKSQSLNMKNEYVAQLMLGNKLFKPFTPQDLTSRIDEMIQSGQAQKMNLNDVGQVVDVLMATDAVRKSDFIHNKDKYYGKETLPQLPFFTAN